MDIQHIKYFLAVAEHRNFSKAAESLFVTQPILTRCIKNLETELGAPLIIRTSKSFALTDVGMTLYQYGKALVESHQDLYRKIDDVKSGNAGMVQIASPGVLLDIYFPKLVTEFRMANPNISINISEIGSIPTSEAVLNGEVDIGLVMLPVEGFQDLDIYPIVRDEVQVLVRMDHPYATQSSVHINELRNDSIITYNSTTTLHNAFIHLCLEHGFTPTIAYQSMMPTFIIETLSYGECVGILPGPMFRYFPSENLTSVGIEPKLPWEIALITKKGRYFSHAAQRFLTFAREYFQRLDRH